MKKLLTLLVVLLCVAGSLSGCKKKRRTDPDAMYNEAANLAKAEYNCSDVSIEDHNGAYVKLDVCGTSRWYRCEGS